MIRIDGLRWPHHHLSSRSGLSESKDDAEAAICDEKNDRRRSMNEPEDTRDPETTNEAGAEKVRAPNPNP